ncbi:hypothetical protein EJV44_24780, partial [Ancylobacter aquaticus]
MVSKIWSTFLIGSVSIVLMLLLMVVIFLLNPINVAADNVIASHADSLHFGSYVEVFDLSFNNNVERLFLVNPENIVIYNNNGLIFYYLDSSSVLCPHEFSLLRLSKSDIKSINESGIFPTVCTNVNALSLLEHFLTLKNNVPDHR